MQVDLLFPVVLLKWRLLLPRGPRYRKNSWLVMSWHSTWAGFWYAGQTDHLSLSSWGEASWIPEGRRVSQELSTQSKGGRRSFQLATHPCHLPSERKVFIEQLRLNTPSRASWYWSMLYLTKVSFLAARHLKHSLESRKGMYMHWEPCKIRKAECKNKWPSQETKRSSHLSHGSSNLYSRHQLRAWWKSDF